MYCRCYPPRHTNCTSILRHVVIRAESLSSWPDGPKPMDSITSYSPPHQLKRCAVWTGLAESNAISPDYSALDHIDFAPANSYPQAMSVH